MTDFSRVNVLFVASEADPLIKVGGLADVAGSLPQALRTVDLSAVLPSTRLDIRLVIPYHPAIRKDLYPAYPLVEFTVHRQDKYLQASAYALELDGLTVYLVAGAPIEQESGVYSADLEADSHKYVFFSLAALELARRIGWKPDILHANDWHTSAAVYSLALNRPTDPFFKQTASLLTVHNLPYLGAMTASALEAFELPPAQTTSLPAWAGHMALPLGLLTADRIVAVSPGYAREIMMDEFGSGLQAFLRTQAVKITGILNGLDTRRWDPARDSELAANFSVSDLAARSANKACLQRQLGLAEDPASPMLAMVTRMDPQKGVDLAVEALQLLLRSPASGTPSLQIAFLGTGNPVLEQAVRQLEHGFPDQVRARITYDERLSRQLYAGADMLLMPSRYEPCGLSQMIAMRYGCIPIARATGGLADTIHDPLDTENSTGFLFKPARSTALAGAIQRAVTVFSRDSQAWQAMQARGMQRDFSWQRSALEYIQQYKLLLDSRK